MVRWLVQFNVQEGTMGLDISVMEHPVLTEKEDELAWRIHAADPTLAARLDGKPEGKYVGKLGDGFRAGSYSGYNRWREWLAQRVHGVMPSRIWDHPKTYEGKPFFELIHFSDCEGAIGPKTSAKLAKDFEEHRIEVCGNTTAGDGYVELYEDFAKAFKRAAETDGFVIFH